MESLTKQTKLLLHDVHNGLAYVERAAPGEAKQIEEKLAVQINTVLDNCDRLEYLVKKEPPSLREEAKLHVDKMKYDCKHLQSALQSLQHRRYQREQEEREREELLMTSFKPNNADTSILIDHALKHNNSLANANRGIDDLLGSGQSILDNLRDQRSTLKSAHKKVLDLMNTLGLSNTVMRLIERRTYQDKFILYGGMIFTCVIMFITIKYFVY